MQQVLSILLFSALLLVNGCRKESAQRVTPAPPVQAASKLTILVVGDPEIAAGVKLLRGEWAERTGGELEIGTASVKQLLAKEKLAADLVIFPSRYLGELVDRNWVRPVRKSVLQSEDLELDELFPLVRNVSLRYGNEVYALTLGEPPLMFGLSAGNADWGELTWDETGSPARADSQFKFPNAVALLVRGASYVQSGNEKAALFDAETMQPRITEPPYVKALQELLATAQPSHPEVVRGDLGWPAAQFSESTRFVLLPKAGKVYRPVLEAWEPNESTESIAFIGFAGRSMSVTRATRNSASAFKLLSWLVSENVASQLSPRSEATLWFRKAQSSQAGRWLPKGGGTGHIVPMVNQLLSAENYFLLPRIPQIDNYLAVLEESVAAMREHELAESVLGEVSKQWNAITDRHGRVRQRQAYRRHLGLDQE